MPFRKVPNMDLSNVPLQVLEKVRNKWARIVEPDDNEISSPCAMCDFVYDSGGRCHPRYCPVDEECSGICDEAHGWKDRRDRFLAGIIAEIERRVV
jgi:hypothetical protein